MGERWSAAPPIVISPGVPFVFACRASEVAEGKGTLVEVDGASVAIFRSGGRLYALDNACPHRDGPLAFGDVKGGTVHCPVHAWPFDLATGRCTEFPEAAVRAYPVRLEGDAVWIEL